jgi:type IV pilus assembly protein PilC
MPKYMYKVKKDAGSVSTGVLESDSQRSAVAQLRALGYFPISVEEQAEEGTEDALKFHLKRIRLKDRNQFFRQLANLLQSGMPIAKALGTLQEQAQNPKLRLIVQDLSNAVQEGSSLAAALERHPTVFPVMYANLTRAGESGGMLDQVLWRMVEFGEKDEELRGKAVGALVYPIFLMLVSMVTIFMLVSFVFPKFVVIFDDFDATLPVMTQIVIAVSSFMGAWWWAVAVAILLVGVMCRSYAKSETGRRSLDALWLKIPVLGDLVEKYEMAKFSRTLGTLFDNGVPVLNALDITSDTLGNQIIQDEVEAVRRRVSEGDSISAGLRDAAHFPPMVVNMFATGEETGELGAVTGRIADAYDVEVDRAVKAFTALLEPIIIVFMGGVVGFLVIAMLLPMLTLSAQVR